MTKKYETLSLVNFSNGVLVYDLTKKKEMFLEQIMDDVIVNLNNLGYYVTAANNLGIVNTRIIMTKEVE